MLQFALAGNPNAGKTTLFNALTGSTARVGNWPGVTVDKREGVYKRIEGSVKIIDLPGIYSLSPYTPEEVIARKFLLEEKPDCIINIVDATNLERNLYLTTQLIELDTPIIVALNMMDVLDGRGDRLDVRALEQRLGVPVVEISALKGENIERLMEKALRAPIANTRKCDIYKESKVGKAIKNAEIALRLKEVPSPLFHAVKLVEKDQIERNAYPQEGIAADEFLKENVKGGENLDTEAVIADTRYRYITKYFSPTLTKRQESLVTSSDKADKILTHKWWGIPIFLVFLFSIFHLTFSSDFLFLGKLIPSFGKWCQKEGGVIKSLFFSEGVHSLGVILLKTMETLNVGIKYGLSVGLYSVGVSEPIVELICEGIIGGLSLVLGFLPQILLLFLLFSLLEDTGYMARVTFMLDKIFRPFGVSGRAFMPMIMGFGCSVPAIISTRTLASQRERMLTVRIIPFFCCGAKMPLFLALSGGIVQAFGWGNADVITCGMYLLGVGVALLSLRLSKGGKDTSSPFIMELPAYRKPSAKNIYMLLWDKAKHFLEKACTVIVLSCVFVWFLSHFSFEYEYVGKEVSLSILASFGKLLQPLFTPLGFGAQLQENGWIFAVAILSGVIAKENVLATLGAIAVSLSKDTTFLGGSEAAVAFLVKTTGIELSGVLAFLAFNLLTLPCMSAVAAAKGELGKKGTRKAIGFWVFVSYLVGCFIYLTGKIL